jgi:UDP-N-acetylglucosamine diphosphorylase / glucose-1-phosphate thymidylyltransferase / UDP-N-acetylgalactosamine diphosphorylase / glucosamine-1-phosphate N-acetyltransferase / galactosamine-1-phosphate N-acetyltransferase
MKYTFVETKCDQSFESLCESTDISGLQVAGTSLREAQIKSLAAAGFEYVEEGAELELDANMWWASEDLPNLADTEAEISDNSFPVRYPWDLLKVNEQLISAMTENKIEGEMSPASQADGFIEVGEGTKILPGVFIEGNVIIGKGCKIGPNCYIRGNTFIGDNCHIGQSVEIKNSLIMNKTNVGHLSYIGDSVLGQNVNLGAGTTSSNLRHDGKNHKSLISGELVDTGRRKFGVIVGNGVHTGINTSFYPGRKLYPGVSTRPGDIVQKDIEN